VDLGTAPTRVDATGRYVLPGAIDVHTHFEMPFMGTFTADDFRTGTAAAAAGGITTVVDWAIQEPGESLFTTLEALEAADAVVHDVADLVERVTADVGQHHVEAVVDDGLHGVQGHAADARRVTVTRDLLHQNVDHTPYEGFAVTGWPAVTISRGEVVFQDGKVVGRPGRGRFVRRRATARV
jgi:dihydroorotase-like cyclic amidohydrolase